MKRRAAEEAQRARMEMEKEKEAEAEKQDEKTELKDEGQQDGGMKEEPETKEGLTQENQDCVESKGIYV